MWDRWVWLSFYICCLLAGVLFGAVVRALA